MRKSGRTMGVSKTMRAKKKFETAGIALLSSVLLLMMIMVLASGCSGGGGGASAAVLEGKFLDSAVEGLEYVTDTQSGVTDVNGTFKYMEGEMVMFFIGDIVLGERPGRPVMTPIDLVEGAVDETHPMVINMARLLQTLDKDMDPENGITIMEEMSDLMSGLTIDFNMDPYAFEHDPNVQMFMSRLNEMDPLGSPKMLAPIGEAQNHLRNTMADIMQNGMGTMSSENGMMN